MLKILQARVQQYVNRELQDVQVGFREGRGTSDQITNIHWIIEKSREFPKNIYFCFIDCTQLGNWTAAEERKHHRHVEKYGQSSDWSEHGKLTWLKDECEWNEESEKAFIIWDSTDIVKVLIFILRTEKNNEKILSKIWREKM